MTNLNTTQLIAIGCEAREAEKIVTEFSKISSLSPELQWQHVYTHILPPNSPYPLHELIYKTIYPDWDKSPSPAWIPTKEFCQTTNLARLMKEINIETYPELHQWSVKKYRDFWQIMLQKLSIKLIRNFTDICDLTAGIETPQWLKNAKLNIAESCFNAQPNANAIIFQPENGPLQKISYKELNELSNRVANSLVQHGFKPGDAIGIDMVMTGNAVAIYLGIIKAGCAVVSIADSFAADEIATRLRIANAKAIFTQDYILRGGKQLPLYEKVIQASAPITIVLPAADENIPANIQLRHGDIEWSQFLSSETQFTPVSCDPNAAINILFSSGTTGDPKAIPWDHTTPIKVGADAYLHQNIQANDVVTWPTNIGWMMGPWLIFAALLNQATIGLYGGSPIGNDFGEFVQNSKTTMLGVIPSLVTTWRSNQTMEKLDWHNIKVFSSTGECSNMENMFYLSWLAGHKPIIEYCGGTEVGGGYITGTVIQASAPSTCTTPAMGLDFIIIDDAGNPTDDGEIALLPPSIGLSIKLLNKDHHQTYYADMHHAPDGRILRRHGDQILRMDQQYFRVEGRTDDTMNLGGIKVGSAEIERVVSLIPDIKETAAIAISPTGGGPSLLIIYAVPNTQEVTFDVATLKNHMQQAIKEHLNPLFKIHDVKIINNLPRTASNKVMRRVLREQYDKHLL